MKSVAILSVGLMSMFVSACSSSPLEGNSEFGASETVTSQSAPPRRSVAVSREAALVRASALDLGANAEEGTAANAGTRAPRGTATIGYGGGPIMPGTPDVYFIWYGNWSGHDALRVLPDLVTSLSGSPYFMINSRYTDSAGRAVSGNVHYAGSVNDAYSGGKSLSESGVEAVVQRALSNGSFPANENAVYFVLTSADVQQPGFCFSYCGWHTYGTLSGKNIKYSWVGNPEQCPSSCARPTPTPNANQGIDGMASTLSHELEETVTDPNLDAWTDSAGENADKCAWTFGSTYATASGATANMRLGTRDYLIQQNFDRTSGTCMLQLPASLPPPVVTISAPSAGTVLHASGALHVVANITGSAAISSASVTWTAAAGTSSFAMTQSTTGTWELSTTMSATAARGPRSFTVTATDSSGLVTTTPSVALSVE